MSPTKKSRGRLRVVKDSEPSTRMTKAELVQIAKKRGFKVSTKRTKAELVAILEGKLDPSPQAPKLNASTRAAILDEIVNGAGRVQAAGNVGVDRVSVWRLMKRDPEFEAAVEEAEDFRDLADNELVERSLRREALEGNVVAAQVWLYNRAPDRWADRRGRRLDETGTVDPDVAKRTLAGVFGVEPDEVVGILAKMRRGQLKIAGGRR